MGKPILKQNSSSHQQLYEKFPKMEKMQNDDHTSIPTLNFSSFESREKCSSSYMWGDLIHLFEAEIRAFYFIDNLQHLHSKR